jgi:hypothetical protein
MTGAWAVVTGARAVVTGAWRVTNRVSARSW